MTSRGIPCISVCYSLLPVIIFILFQLILLRAGLSLIVLFVAFNLSIKVSQDLEKLRPFECGFSPLESRWQRFSIQFFLVSLIFLIFDVELILMFPIVPAALSAQLSSMGLVFVVFLALLTIGFVLE